MAHFERVATHPLHVLARRIELENLIGEGDDLLELTVTVEPPHAALHLGDPILDVLERPFDFGACLLANTQFALAADPTVFLALRTHR